MPHVPSFSPRQERRVALEASDRLLEIVNAKAAALEAAVAQKNEALARLDEMRAEHAASRDASSAETAAVLHRAVAERRAALALAAQLRSTEADKVAAEARVAEMQGALQASKVALAVATARAEAEAVVAREAAEEEIAEMGRQVVAAQRERQEAVEAVSPPAPLRPLGRYSRSFALCSLPDHLLH